MAAKREFPAREVGQMSPAHAARLAMINGHFNLPKETIDAMATVRAAIAEAAETCLAAMNQVDKWDAERVTAFIDYLQMAKNIACDALILPHHVAK